MTMKVVPEMFDFTAKGDVAAATGNDTVSRLAVGATNEQSLTVDSSTASGLKWERALPPMFIQGLTYANNGADATNDLDIAAGNCRDATDAVSLSLSALTKRSDANWVAGTNQGALDTGAVGNSDYYIWAIIRSDTSVTDVLFSLSSTAPTMPTSYDFKRLIGWFKRVAGTIVAFTTAETFGGGLRMLWTVPTLEVDVAATLTTTRRTDAAKVPLNFATTALLTVTILDAAAGSGARVCRTAETDAAPTLVTAPICNIVTQVIAVAQVAQIEVETSATGTFAARSTIATMDNYRVQTDGFSWARRN